MIHNLFRRLLLAMCGIAATSLGLVLLLQERSLSVELERAAQTRLSTASVAAQQILNAHLESLAERYLVVSRTPQFRATLEIEDQPTLAHYADSLLEQHAAARIVFVDGSSNRALAGAGDRELDPDALQVDRTGVIAHGNRAFAVISTELKHAGRLVAVEPITKELLAAWSELCGARVEFASPTTRSAELVERIRRVGPLEMRVASSLESEREAMRMARLNLATAAGFGLALALVVSLFVSRSLVRPIVELESAARRMGAGDLTTTVDIDRQDEIGQAARAFDQMIRSLRSIIEKTVHSADRVEQTSRTIGVASQRFRSVSQIQREHTRATARSLSDINQQMRTIASAATDSTLRLESSIDGSTASFRELSDSGEQLKQNARLLQGQTEEITRSIREVATSAEQVARDTEALLPAVDTTARSVAELSDSARAVSTHAKETARLSTGVVESADQGRQTVQHAAEGMRSTQETIRESERVILELSQRVKEIGLILSVIDDVTEETNLLALNGSIVASQAGEHGRAFAVVADQLRELAIRVQNSTQEIDAVIRAVQTESANAVESIGRGSARAEAGVGLIENAEAALAEIARCARESGERMSESVVATTQQVALASSAAEQMAGVREGIERIRAATRDQAESNEAVQTSGEALMTVAKDLHVSVDIQTRGALRIEAGIETVQGVVGEMTAGLERQMAAGHRVIEEVRKAMEHTDSHESSAAAVEAASRDLEHEADALREAVARFRIESDEA